MYVALYFLATFIMHRDNCERYQVQLAPSLVGHKRLGSYLIDAGLINRGQVEVALNDQQATGMKFGEILVTRGWIKQQTVEFIMDKVVLPERRQSDANTNGTDGNSVKQESKRSHTSPSSSEVVTLQQELTHPPAVERSRKVSANRSRETINSSEVERDSSKSQSSKQSNAGQPRVPPISKRLPSVPAQNDGINWVG